MTCGLPQRVARTLIQTVSETSEAANSNVPVVVPVTLASTFSPTTAKRSCTVTSKALNVVGPPSTHSLLVMYLCSGSLKQMVASDVLWSDPSPNPGHRPNDLRGVGTVFGPDVTEVGSERLLRDLGLCVCLWFHQVVLHLDRVWCVVVLSASTRLQCQQLPMFVCRLF